MLPTLPLPSRTAALVRGLIAWLCLAGGLHAQNISASVAPNSGGSDYFVDIKNTSGGNWYFYSNPTPSDARMSRVNSSGTSETPWGTVPNFAPDPSSQVQNRLYNGEFLRVYSKTVPVNNVIEIEFAYGPSGTRYKFLVTVTNGALVTSMPTLDPNPTGAATVRWRVNFDQPVSGVTAANFAFNNPANISGLSIASVVADSAQPSSSWTITANTGTGNGILGLNWVGHVSESPSVPNSFTGGLYDFTFAPVVNTQPVGGTINRNSTLTLSVGASLRGGGTVNYQWYSGANFATSSLISGATSASYTPPNFGATGSFTYFCKVYTNASTYTFSNTATITVVDPPSILTQPSGAIIASGQTKLLTVSATGTALNYQWYRGTSPDMSNPVGSNSAGFTTPQLSTNTSYWVRVSNAGPTAVNSATAQVSVVGTLAPGAAGYSAQVNQNFGTAFAVTARDSANQPVAGITVSFTAPSSGASGTFPGGLTSANAVTNASGVATAPVFRANTVAGSYQVMASFSGALASNLSVTNLPGPAAALDFGTPPPATVTAGLPFSPAPVVRLEDAFGNVVSGDSSSQATVSLGSGTGSLSGTLSATASAGTFTFGNLRHEVAGPITLAFSAGGFGLTSGTVTVVAGAPATVAATAGGGQSVAPGSVFGAPLEATVRDAFNNPVPSASVTFTAPASGASCRFGNGTTSQVVATDAAGKATATVTSNAVAGAYAVTAAVSGTPGADFALTNESALDAWRFAGFGTYENTSSSGDHATPYQDGVTNLEKFAFNLPASAAEALTAGGSAGLPVFFRDGAGPCIYQLVRRKAVGSPGIAYWVESSDDLSNFAPHDLTGAVVESIDATWERVSVPVNPALEPRRLFRTTVAYHADFNHGPGAVSLRGPAAWINQAIRLTPAINGQLGSVVMENVANPVQPAGFTARFRVKMGPTSSGTPADGISFSVGDLGSAAWGESGPATADHLTVAFDTFENNAGPGASTGIQLHVNGSFLAHYPLNPYTNGNFTDVEVRYDAAQGVTVIYGGTTVLDRVAVPGFTLTQASKYGFGARTGGLNQENAVDEVMIAPH